MAIIMIVIIIMKIILIIWNISNDNINNVWKMILRMTMILLE